MTNATRAIWTKRVREWRASGVSAEEFAEGKDFKASSLRWAESRLRSQAAQAGPRPASPKAVVEPAPHFVPLRTRPSVARDLVIEVGAARIVVAPGIDLARLGEVVRSLSGVEQ